MLDGCPVRFRPVAPHTMYQGGTIVSVTCVIKNYKGLKKQLEDKKKAPRQVLKALTSDAKKRAPGWVAAEVSKIYGVKKGEITGKKIGSVNVQGDSVQNVKIVYKGRPLTHTHFGMSPKSPKPDRGPYTLKATVINGERKTLGKIKKLTKKQRAAMGMNLTKSGTQKSDHSPIMLMRAQGGHYLPFQRKSTTRKDIEAIKTVSLPQMVSSKRTEEGIQAALNVGLEKRMDHHMKRYGLK